MLMGNLGLKREGGGCFNDVIDTHSSPTPRGCTYNCHAQWAENINLRQTRCVRNIVGDYPLFSVGYICTLRTMGGHVGDATNVTPHPWRNNNTLEFQIMDQNFTRAQEIFRSSIVAVGLFLNVLVFSVVSLSRQLRSYPRHIFWAAISIFECLFLVEYALE
jgi:hypothetical protein